jgi:hypothetical protein
MKMGMQGLLLLESFKNQASDTRQQRQMDSRNRERSDSCEGDIVATVDQIGFCELTHSQ